MAICEICGQEFYNYTKYVKRFCSSNCRSEYCLKKNSFDDDPTYNIGELHVDGVYNMLTEMVACMFEDLHCSEIPARIRLLSDQEIYNYKKKKIEERLEFFETKLFFMWCETIDLDFKKIKVLFIKKFKDTYNL